MTYTDDALAILHDRAVAQRRSEEEERLNRTKRISKAVERIKMMLKLELGGILFDGLPITYEFVSAEDCIEAQLVTPDESMCISIRYIQSIDQGDAWLIDEGDETYRIEEWKLKTHLIDLLAGWVEVPETLQETSV